MSADIVSLGGVRHRDRSDDDLALLARAGRSDAFEELVRRHQAFALRIAYGYLRQTSAAKDAAQNAFLDVYRALPRYRAQGKFRAYFHRVLVNQCRAAARARSREAALDEAVEPMTDDDLLRRERQRDLDRALRGLSDRFRVVVTLHYAGGLSHEEIADTLRIPLGTVKSRLFSAIQRLRKALA